MNLAIIPARGGSKRLPRKNIRPFCGRPMIEWPIAAAADSGLFDHILVSTEDAEIAAIAREAGAEVPFVRPSELADDHSTTTDVIAHALSWASNEGWSVQAACCIYATAAFASPALLGDARALLSSDCDYAFAAVRYRHPPQRGFVRRADGSPELIQPQYQETRTQDLPTVYHDSGQFYWGTHQAWVERRPFFGSRTRFVELSPSRAQDIDDADDWTSAEQLFAAMRDHEL